MKDVFNEVALKAALSAANAASDSLMAKFGRDAEGPELKAWMKSPGALVTEADLAADRAIAASLDGSGVEAAVISEESISGDGSGELTWLVDPLCGTVPYRSGMPHWGVNIALRRGPELAVGVIALPPLGRVLTAVADEGVTLNGKQMKPRDPGLPLNESIVGLETDGGEEWRRLLGPKADGRSQLAWPGAISHTTTFASAAYPLAMVCTGGMSGVVFYKIDSMHLAAGALIAQEHGVIVSDEQGNALDWRCEEPYPAAVIAWPSIHGALIEAINAR